MIKCDMCGKLFEAGNRADGTPNGVGFEFEDGTMLNVCSECIAKTGDDPEYFEKFIERWKKENGD